MKGQDIVNSKFNKTIITDIKEARIRFSILTWCSVMGSMCEFEMFDGVSLIGMVVDCGGRFGCESVRTSLLDRQGQTQETAWRKGCGIASH